MTGLRSLMKASLLASLVVGTNAAAIKARQVDWDTEHGLVETTEWGATCTTRDIEITVTHTTDHEFTDEDYGSEIFWALRDREILRDGVYNVSTRECVPADSSAHPGTIQVLAHGATYNKRMWDFPYEPETYSWTRRANLEGYATFAVDNIGAGNSSRPSAIQEVQTAVLAESLTQVIQQLRAGEIDGTQWQNVIFMGYSIGALAGNSIALDNPELIDQLLLFSITYYGTVAYPALIYMAQELASTVDAERFRDPPLGYLTYASLETRIFSHLYGNESEQYDPEAARIEYEDLLDMNTQGEAMTFFWHANTAPNYTNPVYLAIGEHDGTFCPEICTNEQDEIYERFPNASVHRGVNWPGIGHNVFLHSNAAEVMDDALAFMNEHDSA